MDREKEGQLALMIEKLFYIVHIDEQIIKYKTERYLERNERARRVLAAIRGELKQSLQGDIKKFLGAIPSKASVEITKTYDYESFDETYTRIKNALAPIFKRKNILK